MNILDFSFATASAAEAVETPVLPVPPRGRAHSATIAAPALIWERIQPRLKQQLGETAWNRWIQPARVAGEAEGTLALEWPTRFMCDWVQTHYADRIREALRLESPGLAVSFAALAPATTKAACEDKAPPLAAAGPQPASVALSRSSLPAMPAMALANDFGAPLDGRYTFENFVVGKPNELAYAAAYRIADQPGVTINPLFLYGGVGLGKTHLMHAIAWHIQKKAPSRRVMYLSAEKFMFQFIRAIRDRDTTEFKEQFRTVDVLMIDDVQFFSGKDSTQEEFFHTFNALVDQNRQVVISADKSPSDLQGMEERLRSRLGWGLCADIHPTTYELRLGILQAKAEQAPIEVPEKVIQFLAHRITSNVRELEGAFNRIIAHAELVGREIALEGVQELLADLLRANERRVTVEDIQKRVAEHYTIKIADMQSDRRARQVARPRQIAMYLAKNLTSRSLPEIGRRFGGRDHTTVLHAVRKVEELIASDQAIAEDVELLKRLLQA